MSTRLLLACLQCLCWLSVLSAQGGDGLPVDARRLYLRFAEFDPLEGVPSCPPALEALPGATLQLVQFHERIGEPQRAALRAIGAELHQYMPARARLLRMDPGDLHRAGELPFVRWIGPYRPCYRLEEVLLESIAAGMRLPPSRYHIVAVARSDKGDLAAKLHALGAAIPSMQRGSIYLEARLDHDQLIAAAHLDEVLWIDRWSPAETDVDHARTQVGAAHLEALAGYTGIGIRAEVYEGIEVGHPDFAASVHRSLPIAHGCSAPTRHGQQTFGIIFGSGAGRPAARGLCPDAQGLFCNHGCTSTSRYLHVGELVDPAQPWQGMHQTASWGGTLTTRYTSLSADLDNIILDHDITITQSQSNSGTRLSRPQAWAKNAISVGGVHHGDTATPLDDHWSGGASIGPASDGRIKPDLCAYYDAILTTDLGGAYESAFGGTSGATPIVAGAVLLIHQMWTDGLLGNLLPHPSGSRFANRAHFTTIKALLLASARQYGFSGTGHDLSRTHQGWGFPDVARLYEDRNRVLVIDESIVLSAHQTQVHEIDVAPGEAVLKVALVYADREGTLSASRHRINDLDLRVTSPAGLVYRGNQGLLQGNWSVPGGAADDRDTVECVFVQRPVPGRWLLEVTATELNADTHLESAALDADYALVAIGGQPVPPCGGRWERRGSGCPDLTGTQGQTPAMMISALPCLGSSVNIGTSASPLNLYPQFLVLGNSDRTWAGIPLPFDLSPYGAAGCALYTDPLFCMPVPNPGGGGTLSLSIPTDPTIAGRELYWQGWFLSPTANALGLATSDLLVTHLAY